MADLPTRGVLRGARLAALPVSYAGRRAVSVGRRLGGQPAELVAQQVHVRTAEQLFTVLGDLKGGAMKVGQWLSAMEAALPDQVAGPYGDALTRLQEAAPALPTSVINNVLVEDLGPGWRETLRDFQDQPAAAASVGQVHRATWQDGRAVAVKVQYPGAGEALAVDLRQLDRFVPLVRVAAPGVQAGDLFRQLREHVLSETDYPQEAAAQEAFRAALLDDPDYLIPAVVGAAGRVLISEWVDGTPVAEVARTGSHLERDRVGALIVRFLLSSPVRVGRLHGDPHPGNFRLMPDGRLAVLDFGSTLAMPHGWPARMTALLAAARDGDSSAVAQIAADAGLLDPEEVTGADLVEVLSPLLEPLRVEHFAFSRGWLRGQTLRFSDPRGKAARVQRKLRIPVKYLLVQRVGAGTTGVLCSLGARVNVRQEAAAWLPGWRVR